MRNARLDNGAFFGRERAADEKPEIVLELIFGFQCDRTGPTATVGAALCPGYHDYIDLLNSKGGIEGHPVDWYHDVFEIVFPDVDVKEVNSKWKKVLKRKERAEKRKDKEDKDDKEDDDDDDDD